jgi:class 3 adenylate cyclase
VEDPETADFFRRLATLGRLILFDKRDTGLSDRGLSDSSLEERIADMQTVMRAAGSDRAVLFGYSEGAPMSVLFAAIRCAAAIRDAAAALGIKTRAGIHTGEVDVIGDHIAGASVRITDSVAALAQPAEILVSRTVKELVAGSGISFADRGNHKLSGLSEEWPLFAVAGLTG